jgi:hypothetical protein
MFKGKSPKSYRLEAIKSRKAYAMEKKNLLDEYGIYDRTFRHFDVEKKAGFLIFLTTPIANSFVKENPDMPDIDALRAMTGYLNTEFADKNAIYMNRFEDSVEAVKASYLALDNYMNKGSRKPFDSKAFYLLMFCEFIVGNRDDVYIGLTYLLEKEKSGIDMSELASAWAMLAWMLDYRQWMRVNHGIRI